MAATSPAHISPSRTACHSLLKELQVIWNEIGEQEGEMDRMLEQLEQECLDIYRRKVDLTRKHKAELAQSLAEEETEIADLVSALGETSSFSQRVKGTLKQKLSAVKPVLQDLRQRKQARVSELYEIQLQIAQICAEIAGKDLSSHSADLQIDERDLTVKRLGELKSYLKELQTEKNLRLHKVSSSIATIHELSVIMSVDFSKVVTDIHPSLNDHARPKSISNDTLARLTSVIHSLKKEKQERLQQAEVEVERLNVLKASKMKELVLKRQNELEAIYRDVHVDIDSDAAREMLISLIESGNTELSDLLSSIDDQITDAKELAVSRKEVLDKMEKWKHASEEEKWLEDYEKDQNRYNAGRGAHINLKRAEKARILVGKIPSMVENMNSKVKAWESERGMTFQYDKAPLLRTLEEYMAMRQEREDEKRRMKEQKRMQEQMAVEKEALYGSRPKKVLGQNTSTNSMLKTPLGRQAGSGAKERRESRYHNVTPINYVALPKDDHPSSRG
ncbi:65-kDa microtubule-associated protein 5 [Linum grandiflorum]